MGKNLFDKFLGFFGVEEEEVDVGEEQLEDSAELQPRPKRGAPVLSLHTQKPIRVVVMEPRAFDESQTAADHLKNRRPVILNLEGADHDLARRIVDFVSGAVYAVDGRIQKIGQTIFLFVPSNFEIAGEVGGELREKGLFPWISR